MMELVGIAGADQIMARVGLRGTIHSDDQGLVSQLSNYEKLRRVATMAGTVLLTQTWECIQGLPITIKWTRGHPERRQKDHTHWSMEDWGSHFAHQFADPRVNKPTTEQTISHTL